MFKVEAVKKHLYQGIVPAVPIPFTKERRIETNSQKNYITWMNEQPVSGVALWAHTGRGLFITPEERAYVFNSWKKGLGADKLIVCGVGASNLPAITEEDYLKRTLSMGEEAVRLGADAILAYAPTFFRNKNNQDEKIIEYHLKLAELGLPLIIFFLYEEAGGINYSQQVLKELFKMPNVVGIKIATLDSIMTYQDISNLILREAPQISLITGEDRMFGYTVARGAVSALVGLGSIYTKLQHDMMQFYYKGKYDEFLELLLKVDKLAETTFIQPMEGYIERVLYVLARQGIIATEAVYDPFGPGITEKEKKRIDEVLSKLGKM